MLVYYRSFIYFIVVLGFLSYSHFTHANVTVENTDSSAETSTPSSDTASNETEAGNQVQEVRTNITTSDTFQMPDHRFEFTGSFGLTNMSNNTEVGLLMNVFTGDILYRIIQYDRLNSSLGLRARANLRGDHKDIDVIEFHELTFLIQNLVFTKIFSIKSFVGPVFGIHLLKYSRAVYRSPEETSYEIRSSEFVGSFSYQVGIKYGVLLSSHFAITMETGFDQLRFDQYERITGRQGPGNETKETVTTNSPANNTYFTLGISYLL